MITKTETSSIESPSTSSSLTNHVFGLLCFLVPFFRINATDAFYYSCVALLLASCGFLIKTRPLLKLQKSEYWLVLAFISYPLWAGTDMLVRGTWSWNEFKEPSRFILVLPIFFALKFIRFPIAYLYAGIVFGAIWAGLQGLYQSEYLNVYRAGGGASHVTAFGNISLLLGMMSLASLKLTEHKKPTVAVVVLLALSFGLAASMTSGSKGGWISLPLLFWISVDLLQKPTYTKRFASIFIMLAIATLAYTSSSLVQSRVDAVIPALMTYFSSGQIFEGSVGPRLEMWSASWSIFSQNPVFGAGVGSYFEEKSTLIQQGFISDRVAVFVQSHNQLLHSMAEGGLIGVACVYGIYGVLINHYRHGLAYAKPIAVSGLMLTVAFMDFGMADGIWSITNAGTFFSIMAVIFAGICSNQKLVE